MRSRASPYILSASETSFVNQGAVGTMLMGSVLSAFGEVGLDDGCVVSLGGRSLGEDSLPHDAFVEELRRIDDGAHLRLPGGKASLYACLQNARQHDGAAHGDIGALAYAEAHGMRRIAQEREAMAAAGGTGQAPGRRAARSPDGPAARRCTGTIDPKLQGGDIRSYRIEAFADVILL